MVVVGAGSADVSAVAVDNDIVGNDGKDDINRPLFCSWAASKAAEAVRCDVVLGDGEKN
jgi:hypothetical protein